jgi:hypothetical protein
MNEHQSNRHLMDPGVRCRLGLRLSIEETSVYDTQIANGIYSGVAIPIGECLNRN